MRDVTLKNVTVESQGRASQYENLQNVSFENVKVGGEIQTVPLK
jgi:hypothetical protein